MNEKRLGFGMMRLPMVEDAVDFDLCHRMVEHFRQQGGTYFDTALMYCGRQSEPAVRPLLPEKYPRDSFTVATKLHSGFFNTLEDRDRVFGEQLEKTGVEYFDYYLLHAIDAENYKKFTELDCFNWLKEKKKQGLVKKIGFSFHDGAAFLERVLTEHPEMEFVQLQLNYLDWESQDVQSRLCYETARRHGLPVVVMEPVKGGILANVPPVIEEMFRQAHPDWTPASWALRFVMELPGVMAVLSGMSNMEQVTDNCVTANDPERLTEADHALIRRAVEILNGRGSIACTGCAYCVDGCPMAIPIPRCFALYNEDQQQYGGKGWTPPFTYYDNATREGGKASACIACGQCVEACPQHLPIPELLRQVADRFEA